MLVFYQNLNFDLVRAKTIAHWERKCIYTFDSSIGILDSELQLVLQYIIMLAIDTDNVHVEFKLPESMSTSQHTKPIPCR